MKPFSFTSALTAVSAGALGLLAGCSILGEAQKNHSTASIGVVQSRIDRVETTADGTSTALTVDAYKRDIALRITEVNSIKIYPEAPQALLRSVIVVKFSVDAGGQLLRSEIVRSNHDAETEATALATLRNTAPFPKPAKNLLRHGKLEISETWLFNNDGRFQIRSVAKRQAEQ